ncbi:30S ribosomal protein S9 [Flavobacteriales bacterium]|jgi:small subunit ribosomal protein S9|nr:30S ribosomal protein S9 [Flavobacteriales bacterium]MDG1175336.1 30S ribosomal protein S9 [Flavobacteriales bacterium]|tara:strand:- start:1349 stop:1735 length:387 start_codon:yes stop_codon:yes gene_type:complete
MEVINTIGRRKTSIARVYLSEGKGNVTINKKDYKDYFATKLQQGKVDQAFIITDTLGQYDVTINVDGGGFTGQVEAIRLGISRALVKINEEYKPALRAEGLMTRDSRMVERKKPGQKKARKKFQFSKR